MGQRYWNRFAESAEDAPDNLYYFEPALARRRRLASQAKDGKKALEWDRSGSDRRSEERRVGKEC